MGALCQQLSHSGVPLAAARSLCTGIPDHIAPRVFNLPSSAAQLRFTEPGPSFLPLVPPNAGSLVEPRRPLFGVSSRRSLSVTKAVGSSNWASAFGLDALLDKFKQNPSELMLQGIVAGPPSEVVPFVFAEVSDLDNEHFYPPYFLELLVSWQADPTDFEAVFWKTLKQQATGTNRLRRFVAHFLTDRKTAAGGRTGSQLGRRFEGAFLEEGRLNPAVHQLDGLADVLRLMGQNEDIEHDSQRYQKLCKQFAAARDRNVAAGQRLGMRFPREEPPWRASRATPAERAKVRKVAPLEAAPSEDASRGNPEEAAVPSDGSDQLRVEKRPLQVTQQPAGVTQQPGGVTQQPGKVTQQPGGVTQQPGGVTQQPGKVTQQPGGVTRQPRAMTQQPAGMTQQPAGVTQPPTKVTQQPGKVTQQPARGDSPTAVGHPEDVVPFVFGEASDLENEKHFGPLMKELLMSWNVFPDSFEDVFWRIMKQQTTGTYNLKNFLAFFLTDRGVSAGTLTGGELQARLRPRFLEEARFNPVTHQLDGLERILERLPLTNFSAHKVSGSENEYEELSALRDQFRTIRSKNVSETQAVETNFPREVPPWRNDLRPETSSSS